MRTENRNEKRLEEGFETIDFIFARKMLPQGPSEAEYFLAYLLIAAR